MSTAIIVGAGGGGINPYSDVTAGAENIEKGYTSAAKGMASVQAGTLELTGTAEAQDVVKSKKFYKTDPHNALTGSIEDQAAYTDAKSAGYASPYVYVRIPPGAYRTATGAGYPEIKVPQAAVVNAADSTAASKIIKGKTVLGIPGTHDWAVGEGCITIFEADVTPCVVGIRENLWNLDSNLGNVYQLGIIRPEYPYVILSGALYYKYRSDATPYAMGRNIVGVIAMGTGGLGRPLYLPYDYLYSGSLREEIAAVNFEREANGNTYFQLKTRVSGSYHLWIYVYGGTTADFNG